MSLPFRRRPDRGSSAHERARIAAARRMDGPLHPDESAWLDRHLAECAACRAIADAYVAQRLELQALRETPPVPPRDLWARTAAAIEASAGPAGPATAGKRRPPLLRRLRPSPVPLGAISGVMVVVVVVGASLLSSRPLQSQIVPSGTQGAIATPPTKSEEPGPTRIAVTADVSWAVAGDGKLEIFSSRVDEVCATTESPDCAPIEGGEARTVTLPETELDSVILSPEESELVLFEAATSEGGGSVLVVPAPTPPGQTPAPPTPTPSLPTEPPTPPVTPTVPPTASVDPSNPTGSGSPTPTGSIDPNAPVAIATNVIIVGEAASYSADGVWFAFSARPADGSQGPDIYVWQPGWPSAVPITHDHQSVFSNWVDGRILASRAMTDSDGATSSPAPGESALPTGEATPTPTLTPSLAPGESQVPSIPPTARPQAFLLDPSTGQETVLEGIDAWLPSVDPTRRLVVYWDGTLQLDEATREWHPAEGSLVMARWPTVPEPPVLPSGSPPVDASGLPIDPTASPSPTPTAPPSLFSPPLGSGSPPPQLEEPIAILAAGPLTNWDARWDETGDHLAVWIEDALDRSLGRLTLHMIDPETNELVEHEEPIIELALPGFAIGNGRLVWATPGGEDGEGTKVAVVAWTDDAIGSVETQGSNQQVVIVR